MERRNNNNTSVFPRIKFNNNVVKHTYDHTTSPVLHRSTILITDTITLKEKKMKMKGKKKHLPKLELINHDYQHAKPEKPFYAVTNDMDNLTAEERAICKIDKLKSKWNKKDKKRKAMQKQKLEKVMSMSQSVLFGTVGTEKRTLQHETKEINQLMKTDPEWSPKRRKRNIKKRSSPKKNKIESILGKLQLDSNQIERLNFVLKQGHQRQQYNIAEQSVLKPIKLSKEMKIMVRNKVNENISVNLNYIKTGHRNNKKNNNYSNKNNRKMKKTKTRTNNNFNNNNNYKRQRKYNYNNSNKTKADVMHVDMWQDAVLSQYAEELDFDKLAMENPFVIRQDVIDAVCDIQEWWREVAAMRYYMATKLSSFMRGFLVRSKFYSRAHEVYCAVIIIQQFALKVIYYRFKKKVKACIVIQCLYRRYVARKVASSIKIQRVIRRYIHLSKWWLLSDYIFSRLNKRRLFNKILYFGTKALRQLYHVRRKIKKTIIIQTCWRMYLAKVKLQYMKTIAITDEKNRSLEEDLHIHVNLRRIQNGNELRKKILKKTKFKTIRMVMKEIRKNNKVPRKHFNQYRKSKSMMENKIISPINQTVYSIVKKSHEETNNNNKDDYYSKKKKRKIMKKLNLKRKPIVGIHFDYIQLIYEAFLSYDFEETGMITYENGLSVCKLFIPNLKVKSFNIFFNANRLDSRRGLVISFATFSYWLYNMIVDKRKYIYNRFVQRTANIKRWFKHTFIYSRFRTEARRKVVYFHEENEIISKFEKEFRTYKPPNHECKICAKPFALYQHKFYHETLHHKHQHPNDHLYLKNRKKMKTEKYTQLDLDLIEFVSKIIGAMNVGSE